jgi:uncharacterized membrane protein YqgA involved in biofilm formation
MKNIITDFNKFNEGFVGGVMIDPQTQALIMSVVPAIVGSMLGHTFREEIKEWLKDNMDKVSELLNKKNGGVVSENYGGESIDSQTMIAIITIVPTIVGLAFGHTFKDEVKDWLRSNRDKAKSFFKRFSKK